MRVASDRSASMATRIGGAIAAGLHTRGYAVMLRWLMGIISGKGSRPNEVDPLDERTWRALLSAHAKRRDMTALGREWHD